MLQRDAATNHQIFDSLLQRTKETGISGELRTSNIRIVDAAEPSTAPAYPDKKGDLVLALFTAMTLALALVFFFEYLDNRIKSPEELKTHLGLPFLGMVPAVFGGDEKDVAAQQRARHRTFSKASAAFAPTCCSRCRKASPACWP